MFNLSGLNALVTGGSNGIGQAISIALHAHGASVTIVGRNEESLKKVCESINGSYIVSDLSTKEGIQNVVDQAKNIDILVNNAGIVIDNLLWKSKTETFIEILNVNLVSVYELCKHFSQYMAKKKFGRIINMSSVVGTSLGNAGQTQYGASKSAIVGFSKCMAKEFASRNITVNCIAPGFVETGMTSGISYDIKAQILQTIPLKRFAAVEEIASCAVFLASKESSYITGQTISVNGGMVM